MKFPDISIIIPTHRRPKSLGYLLSSIKKHLPENCEAEIIVVSNFEDKATLNMVSSLAENLPIIYKTANTLGVNSARNLGLSFASGSIILFLDDDCIINSSSFFTNHINYHFNFPEYIAIGGPYVNSTETNSVGRVYNLNAQRWIEEDLIGSHQTQNLLGGNTSYKASLFNGRILFNENIIFGGAETELLQRLTNDGFLFGYFKDLQVEHNPPITLFNLCKKAYLQGLGRKVGADNKTGLSGDDNSSQSISTPIYEKLILKLYALFFITGTRTQVKACNQNKLRSTSLSLADLFKTIWAIYLYKLEAPYHFIRLYAWRLKKPLYQLKSHIWKLKKPLYYLQLHLWKLKAPLYYLQIFYFNAAKNLYLLTTKIGPRILKPYYFCKYQYDKRIKLKNKDSLSN